MPIQRTRFAVAAMAAALILTSIASVASANDGRGLDVAPVVPAGDPGGSTTGVECLLEVDTTGEEILSMFGETVVVPLETFFLLASGFAPLGDGELSAESTEFGDLVSFDVTFDSSGNFADEFFFEVAAEQGWRLTMTQADPACSAQAHLEVLPLQDVWDSKFVVDIKWLYIEGITSGCADHRFCPNGLVTRGQMATFLSRALHLPPTSTDYFTDDEGNTHEANINRLRAAGITSGCTATTFCPDGVVTRGQMATFLVRAYHLPATGSDYFTDDETNKHEANINRLRASSITFGCGGTNFCPNGSVTRGQMSAFLHRAAD